MRGRHRPLWAVWRGGPLYWTWPDILEYFASIGEARNEMWRRSNEPNRIHPRFPVEGRARATRLPAVHDARMLVWFARPERGEDGSWPAPDEVWRIGPRGRVVRERNVGK